MRTAQRVVFCSVAAAFLMEPAVAKDRIEKVLIDADDNQRVETWSLHADALPPGSPLRAGAVWSIEKDVLHGGRQEGVDRIRVDNGVLTFNIIPSRGMNIWDARCGDLRLGWDSPVKEIVHPHYINLTERGGLGWLEGFGEWMNRCGLASNGAPGEDRVPSNTGALVPVDLTLHGKVSYLPARKAVVLVEPGEKPRMRVRGEVDETMLFGTQLRLVSETSTEVGSKTITLDDTIENLSATKQEFQLLYHVNFGTPLLEEGAVVEAAVSRVTPRDSRAAEGNMEEWNVYGPPTTGYVEQVYFLKPVGDQGGDTEVLLRNKSGDRGVSVAFNVEELPCLTVWKNVQALEDGYVTGIEPATNYPNNRSFERQNGRVPTLDGRASYRMRVRITALMDADSVKASSARVRKLQGDVTPQLDRKPVEGLCP